MPARQEQRWIWTERVACLALPGACIGAAVRERAEAASIAASAAAADVRASASAGAGGVLDGLAGIVTAGAEPVSDLSGAVSTASVAATVAIVVVAALVVYLSVRYG